MSEWRLYINAIGVVFPRHFEQSSIYCDDKVLGSTEDERFRMFRAEEEYVEGRRRLDACTGILASCDRLFDISTRSIDARFLPGSVGVLQLLRQEFSLWLNLEASYRDSIHAKLEELGIFFSWFPVYDDDSGDRDCSIDTIFQAVISDAARRDVQPTWVDFDSRRTNRAFEYGIDSILYYDDTRFEDELVFRGLMERKQLTGAGGAE